MMEPSQWRMHVKTFQDAVHGAITLHPLCVKVIDTPQFQRLSFSCNWPSSANPLKSKTPLPVDVLLATMISCPTFIKALGTCYFVFPAASHNRFEHCIGVCYLANQLVCALQSRQPELDISEADILCVQLAGLCHDLGHGPFSHLWEQFVRQARPEKQWVHENASTKMFDYLLKANNLVEEFQRYGLKEQDIIFIKEMIYSVSGNGSEWCYRGRPREKAFLYQIVANKQTGIDVDKWDYFLRDSLNLGIKVTFDYHRLIQFSRVIPVEEQPQICIRDKECNNVYDMFHARRVLHRTAYKHRVVQIIDNMVRYPLADVCDDMMAYCNLTDGVLHQILLDEGDHPDLLHAKKILTSIFRRQLYLCVGHTRPSNFATTFKNIKEALERNIPKDSTLTPQDLVITQVELNYGMDDQNPVEMVYFYNKNSPMKTRKIKKEESILVPERFQEKIFRVLCRSNKEDKFKHAQVTLMAACQELGMKEPYFLRPLKQDLCHCPFLTPMRELCITNP
ncbi:deoxynucleoside triphosphate triphosphohydrolase SAMHD1-like isoform X7 [Scylla paramamosain]|uniref:deoxynucleoside triphosphate triphosphohydrolase SAMHD1-like isoform X7 n=1 Tax=Scylla paramamosain TaxID=85552 RepID=UPI00308282DF